MNMKNNHIIKAIVFDVDGVIFKTHDENERYLWSRTAKEDLGLTKNHFKEIFSSNWEDVARGKLETIQYLQQTFKKPVFNDINITPIEYISYWLSKDCHINWDVVEFASSLGLPCYLGTNQESHRTNHIIRLIGKHFKDVFSSYKIGHIKPEYGFFQHIEHSLGLTAKELLLIDDMLAYIEGAKKYGWMTYHYKGDLENLKSFMTENHLT